MHFPTVRCPVGCDTAAAIALVTIAEPCLCADTAVAAVAGESAIRTDHSVADTSAPVGQHQVVPALLVIATRNFHIRQHAERLVESPLDRAHERVALLIGRGVALVV